MVTTEYTSGVLRHSTYFPRPHDQVVVGKRSLLNDDQDEVVNGLSRSGIPGKVNTTSMVHTPYSAVPSQYMLRQFPVSWTIRPEKTTGGVINGKITKVRCVNSLPVETPTYLMLVSHHINKKLPAH